MNGTRRNGYIYNRVLIEAGRILDAQFSDAVVFLTGAQIEMLRNVSQYLSRRDTYVSEYKEGYYITPTDEDYDSILEIVADMEEALMGNLNTVWGYSEAYGEVKSLAEHEAGSETLLGSVVPEGEVWRVTGASVFAASATCTDVRIKSYAGGVHITIGNKRPPSNGHWYPFECDVTLAEGEYFYVNFYGLSEDDYIEGDFWGYKMKVQA